MERLTVFTPTYNRAAVLHRVYDSLVQQTYRDFRWLIVDDGSADDTKAVVDGFAAENKIVMEYVYQENQGKHIATNRAVAMTDSELFVIADSDDGVHFSKPVVLEEDETRGFCYPAMYFVEDGILLAYCSGGKEDGACLNRTTIRKVYI